MEWSDNGIVLSARPHGEGHAVVELLTAGHGRHAGLVYGGAGRRMRPALEIGNLVAAHWRGRLAEHLGTLTIELEKAEAARFLDDPLKLAGLSAACAVASSSLPEREPHPALYEAMRVLIAHMEDDDLWPALYVKWELGLLQELGFGLDLDRCAVTGASGPNAPLTHVSPKSGRAVSAEAAEPYLDKLLPLPGFLRRAEEPQPQDIADGLSLSGHFLERRVFHLANKQAPEPRRRLEDAIARTL
ncbi:MAG: DNA repair protein RecO [Pseudomonadota bacterium]